MSSSIFDKYTLYYDLLYRDKNYNAEADYIDSLIKEQQPTTGSILDMGCGTGNHAKLLNEKGYIVHGIDASCRMLEIAKKKETNTLSFALGDVRTYDCGRTFDAVTSLFHVASYQTSNMDIIGFVKTARRHLKSEGLFIFDFWYGPAVISDRPSIRQKIIENDALKVVRDCCPKMIANQNTCEVNYDIVVIDKKNDRSERFSERHSMRYFFLPEIELLLSTSGLKMLAAQEWMSGNPLSFETWNALVVAQLTTQHV